MKFLLTTLILCIGIQAFCKQTTITATSISAGTDAQHNVIKGTEYTFPHAVVNYGVSGNDNTLLVLSSEEMSYPHFRNYIYGVDLNNNNVKWEEKVLDGNIFLYKDKVFLEKHEEMYCYNAITGEVIWGSMRLKDIISPEYQVGYNSLDGVVLYSNTNGGILWSNGITAHINEREVTSFDASSILITGKYLHCVNRNTGKSWSFEDHPTSALNIIGDFIYFSTPSGFVCLDGQGHTVWSVPIPDGMITGVSSRSVGNGMAFLNLGYKIIINGRTRKTTRKQAGKPFLASYDKKTGAPVYFDSLNDIEYVQDRMYNEDTLLLMHSGGLNKYNLANGNLMANNKTITDIESKALIYPYRYYIVYSDSDIRCLADMYKGCYFLKDDKGTITIFDAALHKLAEMNSGQYTYMFYESGRYKLLGTGTEMFIITNNRRIAEIPGSPNNCIITEGKLYKPYQNTLIVVDLNEIK